MEKILMILAMVGIFALVGLYEKNNPQRNQRSSRRSSDHWPEGEKDADGNDVYEDS